jgi:glucose/arabinose dehydrogenase
MKAENRPIRLITLLIALLVISSFTTDASSATLLTLQLVDSGYTEPLLVTSPPADSTRLFVLERRGQIKLIKNGIRQAKAFLNVSTLISTGGSEQGLLGLAFHPNYAVNGKFYVNYTNTAGDTRVVQYTRSATNPDTANSAAVATLLSVDQPASNHNGGHIAFGPDGYLYVGLGDGGGAGDPNENGQNPLSPLGKMLRLDVDRHPLPPVDNPYLGHTDTLELIWAIGLRNPWRFTFDRSSGDLYIADVGQNAWEEINFQPVSSNGKENYGWDVMEGLHCYEPSSGCNQSGKVLPVHEYSHSNGCSISGGYVYRGCAIPDLQGTYFYADYCNGRIWTFVMSGGVATNHLERTTELGSAGMNISSFGEDARGELYICSYGTGRIYKIVPNGVPSQCTAGCCSGIRGNVNGDAQNKINIGDVTYLVKYLFQSGMPPPCITEANVNGDPTETTNIADITYLVAYLFQSGQTPASC